MAGYVMDNVSAEEIAKRIGDVLGRSLIPI